MKGGVPETLSVGVGEPEVVTVKTLYPPAVNCQSGGVVNLGAEPIGNSRLPATSDGAWTTVAEPAAAAAGGRTTTTAAATARNRHLCPNGKWSCTLSLNATSHPFSGFARRPAPTAL